MLGERAEGKEPVPQSLLTKLLAHLSKSGPSSTPIYEKRPAQTPKGVEYIPVTLSTGPNPLDVRNQGMASGKPWPYHLNVYELAEQNDGKKGFTREAMRADRARGNFICGYAGAAQPTDSGNRGHLHTDTGESWIVMLGELRWVFEGDVKNAVIARQGDIVYAVPNTFHSPQFWGKEGLNCRLTNSTVHILSNIKCGYLDHTHLNHRAYKDS